MSYVVRVILFVLLLVTSAAGLVPAGRTSADSPILLQSLGHASFLITLPDGMRIVTDPYGNNSGLSFRFPKGIQADLVTISHSHPDHNAFRLVEGNPTVLSQKQDPQTFGSVTISTYISKHGSEAGVNLIFVFQIGDVKLVHLGAAGVITDPDTLAAIQDADVVIAQVSTIDPEALMPFMQQIRARTVIPVHFSQSANRRYYGAPTVDEVLTAMPPETPITQDVPRLEMTAGMPTQVVLMARFDPLAVNVRYVGHASFLLTAPDGTRLVFDPFSGLSRAFPPSIEASAVVISHPHDDHNASNLVQGDPVVITTVDPQTVGPYQIAGYATGHGEYNGTSMGPNNVFVVQTAGIKIVHLGDTGPISDQATLDALSDADVVFAAICSACLQPDELLPLVESIRARTVVLMEYSLSASNRYYGAPTVGEFMDGLPAETAIARDVPELNARPGMPVQVISMTPWTFPGE